MIGNKFRNSFGAHRALGDLPARAVCSYSGFCNTRSPANSTTVQAGTSFPVGLPNGWYPPIEGGEMVMRSTGSSSMTANLYPSKSMAIDLTGFGDLQATAGLVISMLCAMTGSGTLTAAIEGRLNMSADFTGSGDLEASMSGIGNMLCDMTGTGDLEAVIAAYGNMAIDIVVTGTGLTTANVGRAVWSALSASNNDPDTMGEKLNNASGLTPEQVQMLIELWTLAGLDETNPLVVTSTSRDAGTISQTIEDSSGIVTVTRD